MHAFDKETNLRASPTSRQCRLRGTGIQRFRTRSHDQKRRPRRLDAVRATESSSPRHGTPAKTTVEAAKAEAALPESRRRNHHRHQSPRPGPTRPTRAKGLTKSDRCLAMSDGAGPLPSPSRKACQGKPVCAALSPRADAPGPSCCA
jgi:hypothetical protein